MTLPDANVSATQLATLLVADPRCAYLYPTDLLERAAAVLRALYGGGEERIEHKHMRAAEGGISATLRARRDNAGNAAKDRAEALAKLQRQLDEPPPDRGWKVKPKRPAPILPNAGALRPV